MLIYISIWNMSALMKKRGIRSLIETLGAAQKKELSQLCDQYQDDDSAYGSQGGASSIT